MWNFTIQGYIQSTQELSSQSSGSEQSSQDIYTVKQITYVTKILSLSLSIEKSCHFYVFLVC